jgi:4-hydroxy-tetrahydrodipicolinate synthase
VVCQGCAKDTAGLLRARRLNGVAQPKKLDIGRSILPSPIYHIGPAETVETLRAVAAAGDLPVMIYSNQVAYRVT